MQKKEGGGRKSKKIQEAQKEHTTTLTTDVKRDWLHTDIRP